MHYLHHIFKQKKTLNVFLKKFKSIFKHIDNHNLQVG